MFDESPSFEKLFVPFTNKKAIIWLIVIGITIYFNALFGDFVWDDYAQIVNSSLAQGLSNIPQIFSVGQLGIFYRPVFLSFLTLINSIFGGNVFFFHFFQISIHISNAILIFLLFRKFFGKNTSFFLASLFLVHPINTEAVSYISAVSDPLFVFLGLIAFHIMSKDKIIWLSFSVACFFILFSLLTKEAGFLMLLFISVYRLLFKRREILLTSLFIIIPAAIYFFLRFFVAHTFFAKAIHFAPIADAPFYERLITIPKIIFFYIYTFMLPVKLSIAQHWMVKSFTLNDFYTPLIVVIVFSGIVAYISWRVYKHHKNIFSQFVFFTFWFLISLALYLQIFPLDMTVAERWFYLPMIGLLGLIGVIGQLFKFITEKNLALSFACLIFILVLLSTRTMVRNTNWINSYALLSHDVKTNQNSFDIENNLSVELAKLNKHDEALIHAQKSTKLNPKYSPAWTTLGVVYTQKKEYKKAVPYFMTALENDGGNYVAFYNLIYVYLLLGDNSSAKGWSQNALRSFNNDPPVLLFLAVAEYKLGNREKATALAKQSYELRPTEQSQSIYNTIQNGQDLKIE